MTNHRIDKKQVASMAGICPRTLRNNREKFSFLERCRMAGTRRPTYNRAQVELELRRRKML